MLMGHPPPIITRGRENASQGCFEGLTPVQVPMVMEELVARDAQVQEALAATPEVVQKIPQAGPHTFPRVTGHTRAVRGTTRLRAGAMVDRPLVIVGLGKMGDGVCSGEALSPALHLGGKHGGDRRGAHGLPHGERALRGWCVLVAMVAALDQAQQGGTAHLGGGATAKLKPAWSRCTCVVCDTIGPAYLAQVISSFLVILQVREQVFHQVAPMGRAQPHYIDTVWVKL
jgi:hypothetical protein